jgi:hypothetical protein
MLAAISPFVIIGITFVITSLAKTPRNTAIYITWFGLNSALLGYFAIAHLVHAEFGWFAFALCGMTISTRLITKRALSITQKELP